MLETIVRRLVFSLTSRRLCVSIRMHWHSPRLIHKGKLCGDLVIACFADDDFMTFGFGAAHETGVDPAVFPALDSKTITRYENFRYRSGVDR